MSDITSTYQLSNYYPSGGDLFTQAEANSCFIVYTKKISFNSVFSHWEIKVRDDLGNTYAWKDFRTAEGASKSTVKGAIGLHLTQSVVKIKEDSDNAGYLRTESSPSDRGKDEYIGE
jgi:hypothetical protein